MRQEAEQQYRFISKDGRFKTRWRVVPLERLPEKPSGEQKWRLGKMYRVEIRTRPPDSRLAREAWEAEARRRRQALRDSEFAADGSFWLGE